MIVVATALISGCVTQYRPEGFGGGYTDFPLGANRHRIEVRGNGFTRPARVQNIAMVRAADLAVANGFTHFYVLESSSDIRIRSAQVDSDTGQISTVDNDYIVLIVELTNEPYGVDAAATLRTRGPSVGYRGSR